MSNKIAVSTKNGRKMTKHIIHLCKISNQTSKSSNKHKLGATTLICPDSVVTSLQGVQESLDKLA